jgi:hypothetical protein
VLPWAFPEPWPGIAGRQRLGRRLLPGPARLRRFDPHGRAVGAHLVGTARQRAVIEPHPYDRVAAQPLRVCLEPLDRLPARDPRAPALTCPEWNCPLDMPGLEAWEAARPHRTAPHTWRIS